MSLKDEIEKMIQAEREKLESRDEKNQEYQARQKERFKPLRTLIEELVATIEPEYIEMRIIRDNQANIDLGQREELEGGHHFTKNVSWRIEPNYEIKPGPFIEAPGFKMGETVYHHDHQSDKEKLFKSEAEVISYLARVIAEQVAFYRHIKSKHDS